MRKSKMCYLNNKGFAITSVIYAMLLLFVVLMLLIIATLARKKNLLDKSKNDALNSLGIYEEVYNFGYKEENGVGVYQEFVVPKTGLYRIELWGAQGGSSTYSFNSSGIDNYADLVPGGLGGYVSGNIYLTQGERLFVYVGKKGTDGVYNTSVAGGYNGGGIGGSHYQGGGSGGGATDIRLEDGNWNDFASLKSRIMVAGAGAGASNYTKAVPGGAGGGLVGYDGKLNIESREHTLATGGTQKTPGQAGGSLGFGTAGGFGFGGNAQGHGSGGGSGYYGGGGSGYIDSGVSSGAGGSSFISGHLGCNAIDRSSSATAITHTNESNHYSGKIFTNTIMIDGEGYKWTDVKQGYTGMPTYNGQGTMEGNSGNGFAKISLL